MPDPQASDQSQPMEASTTSSAGLPINFPNLPVGAAMRRSIIGRYDLWQMIEWAHNEGPQMHMRRGQHIRRPRMRGGLMRENMRLVGEPRGLLINFQGGRGMAPPRGIQRRGMGSRGMAAPRGIQRRGMGSRGMAAPRGIQRRGMAPPQGIEPQRSREPKRKRPRGKKNQSVEPREMEEKEEDMEPPRGTKRRSERPQGMEPQVIAPGGMEPPKGI